MQISPAVRSFSISSSQPLTQPASTGRTTRPPTTEGAPDNARLLAFLTLYNEQDAVQNLVAVVRAETPWMARLVDCVMPCRLGVALEGACAGLVLTSRGIEPSLDGPTAPALATATATSGLTAALDAEVQRVLAGLPHLALHPLAPANSWRAWLLSQSAEEL